MNGCHRFASKKGGNCKDHMYGKCACGRRADGPHGLCGFHYKHGPEAVATQGWKSGSPGVVYLAEWPNGRVKYGKGLTHHRADVWAKNGANLYAVVEVPSGTAAAEFEGQMKIFLSGIGERTYPEREMAPRYLQKEAGWAECWTVDEVYLDAVRGQFDRLTHRLTSANAELDAESCEIRPNMV